MDGLGRLYSLEKLDISGNKIELLSDISGVAKLPNLTEIFTNGNPVAEIGMSSFILDTRYCSIHIVLILSNQKILSDFGLSFSIFLRT